MQNEVIKSEATQSDSEKKIGVDLERATYNEQRMREKEIDLSSNKKNYTEPRSCQCIHTNSSDLAVILPGMNWEMVVT